MKKITLTTSILALLSISCNKATQQCENWEFQDVCTPKTNSANCYEYAHRVSNICDYELQDAHEGRTSIIHEDSTKIIERHYIRRAN